MAAWANILFLLARSCNQSPTQPLWRLIEALMFWKGIGERKISLCKVWHWEAADVGNCPKVLFRHASVFKTHRHAVYHCLKEVQKPFRHASVFKRAFRHARVRFKTRVNAHLRPSFTECLDICFVVSRSLGRCSPTCICFGRRNSAQRILGPPRPPLEILYVGPFSCIQSMSS